MSRGHRIQRELPSFPFRLPGLGESSEVSDLGMFFNFVPLVRIYSIGTSIESYTGPGTVALFFGGQSTGELRGEACENSDRN